MRSSLARFPPVVSLLAMTTFAMLSSCGGNDRSSSADTPPPSPSSQEPSLFLEGALTLDSQTCVAEAEARAPMLAGGILDLAFRSNYAATLLVKNLAARPGSSTDTERVALRSAEITLSTLDGAVLAEYASVGAGFVDASSGATAYAAMPITVIPPALPQIDQFASAGTVLAKIRALGESTNGTMLTSTELAFPIRVCKGCLVEYPVSALDTMQPAGSSYLCTTAASAAGAQPAPCVVGQDVSFSCVLCAASLGLCRDPMLNPSYAP